MAAGNGQLKVIKWLLAEGGAVITEADNDWHTPLLSAASNGQLEVVKWLLAEGGASMTEEDICDVNSFFWRFEKTS